MSAPSPSSRLTLEQRRAQHAWKSAQAGVAQHSKDYVNDATGLPALIIASGLMQTMAFLQHKGGRHQTLATHLRDWLSIQCAVPKDFAGFMTHLHGEADARRYQLVTSEAMHWLRWLRQMAKAVGKAGSAG